MMVDRSSFYGSRHLFDQYGDMRLDVDNMTYEVCSHFIDLCVFFVFCFFGLFQLKIEKFRRQELLALGDRIGNVNTGLSGGMVSNCLVEKTNFLSDHDLEEANCPICLVRKYNSASLIRKC